MNIYNLLNLHDSLPFITISARPSNGIFTDSVGVLRSSSGEWIDPVAIVFYLSVTGIHQLIVYGFIIYSVLYDVAV
jgi:hypothetical protein